MTTSAHTRKPVFHLNLLPLSLHQIGRLQAGHGVFIKYKLLSEPSNASQEPVALTTSEWKRLLKAMDGGKDFFLKQTQDQMRWADAHDREKLGLPPLSRKRELWQKDRERIHNEILKQELWQKDREHEGTVGGGIGLPPSLLPGSHFRSGLVTPAENLAKAYLTAQSAQGSGLYLPQGRGLYLA
jgi:hypothetical protein